MAMITQWNTKTRLAKHLAQATQKALKKGTAIKQQQHRHISSNGAAHGMQKKKKHIVAEHVKINGKIHKRNMAMAEMEKKDEKNTNDTNTADTTTDETKTHIDTSTVHNTNTNTNSNENTENNTVDSTIEQLQPITFDDNQIAFANKSSLELMRSWLVLRLSAVPMIVKNSRKMLDISYAVLGKTITNAALKTTFFGHFCGGEDEKEIQHAVAKLEKAGIGSILDYAAEPDVDKPRDREGVVSARTYDYMSEAVCDANADIAMLAIEHASRRPDGFAAIKMTALGKPELLEHMSKVIRAVRAMYKEFLDKQASDASTAARKIWADGFTTVAGKDSFYPDVMTTTMSFKEFTKGIEHVASMPKSDVRSLFDRMDIKGSGALNIVDWINYLDPRTLGGLSNEFRAHGLPTLSDDDLACLDALFTRIERLAQRASDLGVRLMIDAEHWFLQAAIDHVVLDLQRRHNHKRAVIFQTYQCYLKDTHSRIQIDMERAHRERFILAAKLVRGAYMVFEAKYAEEHGLENPVHATLADTHDSYYHCVELFFESARFCEIMIATHNENTVRYVIERMRALKLKPRGSGVYFAQLYGMSDPMTYIGARLGYNFNKYLPYGPVQEVLPYLLRRAEENASLLGGASKERTLLVHELLRRHAPSLLRFTRPLPDKIHPNANLSPSI